eukprot:CAMPEP_0118936006 /NCGR_PEP_ID=MMETSP1169-20130426/15953_1 /TAXON_ID=36882 /ORGANISM="Pyramimonas obovata, Strain CCMP722" /LENGTH=326 /DNA_ID=CAMNT_0006879095 /DNA_START=107 /DNA_END=1087 /DNA_ORIENTATION=+
MAASHTTADREVVSKTLKVESKLFYLDLKENSRGRYLKISEKAAGTRSTIIVPAMGISWFVEVLNYYVTNGGSENGVTGADGTVEGNLPPAGGLASKELQTETKLFFFDVGENARGRFLRISERGGAAARSLLIVPDGGATNSGWAAFNAALASMHEANQQLPLGPNVGVNPNMVVHGMESLSLDGNGNPVPGNMNADSSNTFFANSVVGSNNLPPSVQTHQVSGAGIPNGLGQGMMVGQGGLGMASNQMVRSGQKRFFFDVGTNPRGTYLRISEVVGASNDRSSIVIPTEVLKEFYGVLGTWVEAAEARVNVSGTAGPPTGAPSA